MSADVADQPEVSEARLRNQAESIVGTVFDNTGASHETLKQVMVERIAAALLVAYRSGSYNAGYVAGLEAGAKAQCDSCDKGVPVKFQGDAFRHLSDDETLWVFCSANRIHVRALTPPPTVQQDENAACGKPFAQPFGLPEPVRCSLPKGHKDGHASVTPSPVEEQQ